MSDICGNLCLPKCRVLQL